MSGTHQSESQLFILAEMLKGRKLQYVDTIVLSPDNRFRKCRAYYVGELKVNALSSIHAIESGLVKSIGDKRYVITRKGRKVYGRGR